MSATAVSRSSNLKHPSIQASSAYNYEAPSHAGATLRVTHKWRCSLSSPFLTATPGGLIGRQLSSQSESGGVLQLRSVDFQYTLFNCFLSQGNIDRLLAVCVCAQPYQRRIPFPLSLSPLPFPLCHHPHRSIVFIHSARLFISFIHQCNGTRTPQSPEKSHQQQAERRTARRQQTATKKKASTTKSKQAAKRGRQQASRSTVLRHGPGKKRRRLFMLLLVASRRTERPCDSLSQTPWRRRQEETKGRKEKNAKKATRRKKAVDGSDGACPSGWLSFITKPFQRQQALSQIRYCTYHC